LVTGNTVDGFCFGLVLGWNLSSWSSMSPQGGTVSPALRER